VDSIHVAAPAKINLGLSILGTRPDGYHDIETLFQKISLYDEITIRRTGRNGEISLTCDDPTVPTDTSNLAARAATLLMQDCGVATGLAIALKKRIPAGAGLGGGSSNAAATLHAVNRLLDLHLSDADLMRYGRQLGADVPFFVISAPAAYAQGIGDLLTPVCMRTAFWVLIVFPRITISTAWAYTTFSRFNSLTKLSKHSIHLNSFNTLEDICANLQNDFERVVFPAHPRIQVLRDRLLRTGARAAALSGSGSSVFGLFGTAEACARAHEALAAEPDVTLFIAQALQDP